MKKFICPILPVIFLLCACRSNVPEPELFDVEEVIRSADVVRTVYPQEPTVYLYQGNGRFGSSYGPAGLHLNPMQKNPSWGKTHYLHLDHVGRGKFSHDYLLPMMEIYWERNFEQVSEYRQHQSYYDGTITTSFMIPGNGFEVKTWFDPVDNDLSVITIRADKAGEKVVLAPCSELSLHYGQHPVQEVLIEDTDQGWVISLECFGRKSLLYCSPDMPVKVEDGVMILTLDEGDNNVLISYGSPSKVSASESLAQTQDWWHEKWDASGCLKLTDDKAQKVWVRSMAMFLSSYNDDKKGLGPPMGFTGNWWPFYYPQDVSYVHPVLLAAGHVDIARSWIEYWAERADGLREYTKRLYGVDGLLAPWVYPYGGFEGYHDPTPPNKFFYEIHNSGYFARMACETAIHVDDKEWTKKYALPILSGCAEFYANIAGKGEDGLWHLYVTPSMGQDERGGENQQDYLCASYSALYCLQQAVRFGIDKDGRYARILKDGLGFESLKSPHGFYYSCAGRGEEDFGQQKHPVQLNELAFLPVGEEMSPSASIAYDLRYDITRDARKPYFYGWTLGEFLLAGSRVGNPEEWKKDWANMERSSYVDPEWIQIYETSGNTTTPFYNITNGLVAQSLMNNLVCDWYGRLELAKCNPWHGKVQVKDIRSLLGVTVDGEMRGSSYDVTLTAWKDTEFQVEDEHIRMKKGDRKRLVRRLSLSDCVHVYDEEKVEPNGTGWAYWFIPARGVSDTLSVKMSMVDKGVKTHDPHSHFEDELFYMVEGDAIVYLNGEEQVLHPGDAFYAPGNSWHNIRRTDMNQAIRYVMFKRETGGRLSKPFLPGKEDYRMSDCYVPYSGEASLCYLSKEMSADGLNVVRTRTSAGHEVETADKQAVYFLLDGVAKVTLNGEECELRPLASVYVRKGSKFSISPAEGGGIDYMTVYTE